MTNIVKNSNHTIEITNMTPEGQGMGQIDAVPVLVEQAISGELVDIKIIKITKKYAVAKLRNIARPSPDRVEPFCPVFKRCGGCSLQHIGYIAQLRLKTQIVKDAFHSAGLSEPPVIHHAIGMANPLHYRHKAQYPIGEKEGEPVMGFYAKRSHEIVEHADCPVQADIIQKIVAVIRTFLSDHRISIYDETQQRGLVRHLIVRVGYHTGDTGVTLVINGADLPHKKELVVRLMIAVPGMTSVTLNINEQAGNVILGTQNIVIHGKDAISDRLGEARFEISPLSFYQVNPAQTEMLYRKTIAFAGLTGQETVFDLYSGIGAISLLLARQAQQVYAVESLADAVSDAKRNAALNGVTNAEFLAGDAAAAIPELSGRGIHAEVVVVDPPRKGCDARLLDALAAMRTERIVYVSCHPASLARDAAYLSEKGFRVAEVQPVDLFPHTAHVECVARIERNNE